MRPGVKAYIQGCGHSHYRLHVTCVWPRVKAYIQGRGHSHYRLHVTCVWPRVKAYIQGRGHSHYRLHVTCVGPRVKAYIQGKETFTQRPHNPPPRLGVVMVAGMGTAACTSAIWTNFKNFSQKFDSIITLHKSSVYYIVPDPGSVFQTRADNMQ